MIGKKLLSKEPLPLSEVEEIIKKQEKAGELTYEQNLTKDYCKKFNKLKKAEVKALVKTLAALDNVDEKNAVILANLMPLKAEEIQLIFAKEHFIISEAEIKSILEALDKFRK